ncbi:MAG TPA: hypothetical protein DCP90_08475 [Clostridiales bacterium]|nr:MAG: hypothetical protein A2Y22_08285 [Clostridiales bacterium GWD2_32_59]HAN10628.1 hypothetical protein [Clostridiales bacterium]
MKIDNQKQRAFQASVALDTIIENYFGVSTKTVAGVQVNSTEKAKTYQLSPKAMEKFDKQWAGMENVCKAKDLFVPVADTVTLYAQALTADELIKRVNEKCTLVHNLIGINEPEGSAPMKDVVNNIALKGVMSVIGVQAEALEDKHEALKYEGISVFDVDTIYNKKWENEKRTSFMSVMNDPEWGQNIYGQAYEKSDCKDIADGYNKAFQSIQTQREIFDETAYAFDEWKGLAPDTHKHGWSGTGDGMGEPQITPDYEQEA